MSLVTDSRFLPIFLVSVVIEPHRCHSFFAALKILTARTEKNSKFYGPRRCSLHVEIYGHHATNTRRDLLGYCWRARSSPRRWGPVSVHVAHCGGTPWEVTEHQQRHHQPAFAVTHDFTRYWWSDLPRSSSLPTSSRRNKCCVSCFWSFPKTSFVFWYRTTRHSSVLLLHRHE